MNPVSSTVAQLIQPITEVASKILILELVLEKKNYIIVAPGVARM